MREGDSAGSGKFTTPLCPWGHFQAAVGTLTQRNRCGAVVSGVRRDGEGLSAEEAEVER